MGEVHPLDAQVSLSCYRGIVEYKLLLETYNNNFYNEETRMIRGQAESILREYEKDIGNLFSGLIKVLNREE